MKNLAIHKYYDISLLERFLLILWAVNEIKLDSHTTIWYITRNIMIEDVTRFFCIEKSVTTCNETNEYKNR